MRFLLAPASSMCLALALSSAAHASVTYDYVGNTFTSTSGRYTANEFVSGSLTLVNALAPNLSSFTTVTPLAFSFSDGPETISNTTPNAGSQFFFKTDALGNITGWGATVYVSSVAQFSIATVDAPGVYGIYDLAQHGGGTEEGLVQNQQGTWRVSSVPEASSLSLELMGLVLLMTRRKRQQRALA